MDDDGDGDRRQGDGEHLIRRPTGQTVAEREHQVIDRADAANAEPRHHQALVARNHRAAQPQPHRQRTHDQQQIGDAFELPGEITRRLRHVDAGELRVGGHSNVVLLCSPAGPALTCGSPRGSLRMRCKARPAAKTARKPDA